MLPNRFRRYKLIEIAAATATLLIVTLVGILFLSGNSPTQMPTTEPTPNPIPFNYRLDVSPTNGTTMQGNSVQINVTLAYVTGSPENIMLSAAGIPDGADYAFSQPHGFPSNDSTFTSTLVIHVSEDIPTSTYNVTIKSATDTGKTYSSQYKLSVLNSKVTVSGIVSVGTGVVPTQIIFDPLSNSGATVQTFTAPVQSGNYALILPNKQFFAVSVTWEDSEGASGTHHFIMLWNTDAGVGITQINCPFSWGP
jgi:hypothetical protein